MQADTTMFYDSNGNLIRDLDRGIIAIRYNILNLPDTIQFVNGNQIVNLYDAAGKKYRSIIYTNITTAISPYYNIAHHAINTDSVEYRVTEYANNVEYYYTSRDTTRRIFNTIGYYSDSTYYHYIKDHLGNICAVVHSTADSVVQSTKYYASGVPMAESTGRDEQPYLYNGKEFIEAHGLNEYDSKARMYYAPIMRTTTIDPMCESYYHISPYAWCGNNPVNRFDPDGKKWKTKRDISIALKLSSRAHSNIEKQLSKLNKLQIKRSKSPSEKKMDRIDKEIADVQIQLKHLANLEKNITLLTNTEENTYTFKIVDATIAHLEKTEDGTIVINHFDNEGSKAHELTHSAQYEKGKVVYDEDKGFYSNTPEGLVGLEIEAYQTEYSINGYVTAPSDEGDVESSLDINEDWIKGIRDPITGGYVYTPEADHNNP